MQKEVINVFKKLSGRALMAEKQTKKMMHTFNAQRIKDIEKIRTENSRLFVDLTKMRSRLENHKFWVRFWGLAQGLGLIIFSITLDYIANILNIHVAAGHGDVQNFILIMGISRTLYAAVCL